MGSRRAERSSATRPPGPGLRRAGRRCSREHSRPRNTGTHSSSWRRSSRRAAHSRWTRPLRPSGRIASRPRQQRAQQAEEQHRAATQLGQEGNASRAQQRRYSGQRSAAAARHCNNNTAAQRAEPMAMVEEEGDEAERKGEGVERKEDDVEWKEDEGGGEGGTPSPEGGRRLVITGALAAATSSSMARQPHLRPRRRAPAHPPVQQHHLGHHRRPGDRARPRPLHLHVPWPEASPKYNPASLPSRNKTERGHHAR